MREREIDLSGAHPGLPEGARTPGGAAVSAEITQALRDRDSEGWGMADGDVHRTQVHGRRLR
jgi:hypothetical protein